MKAICKNCMKEFEFKPSGFIPYYCQDKECQDAKVEQVKQKQKEWREKNKGYQKQYKAKKKKDKIENIGKGFYASQLLKDKKKDWSKKKITDIHGNVIEQQVGHSSNSSSNFRQRSVKIV
jgi:hypothetical protein